MPPSAAVLYVVATPIGNLEDLTFRALRVLKEVDLIAAEDTRRTAKLLAHYDIHTPLVSLREHNEARETPRLIATLETGRSIALVSDAGTPAIADPGARLVRAARQHAIRVVPVPGPSAVTAALSISGLPDPEFVFLGFPPATGSTRRRWLDRLASEHRAIVLFEAPHRIRRTLDDLRSLLANRPIYAYREISKIHEQLVIWPNKDDSASVAEKGEFTLVIEPLRQRSVDGSDDPLHLIDRLIKCGSFSQNELAQIVCALNGLSLQTGRRLVKKHMYLVNR